MVIGGGLIALVAMMGYLIYEFYHGISYFEIMGDGLEVIPEVDEYLEYD